MFKILDKRNGEVTASQQAVFNKISTNNADGYVDGFLNSLRIAKMSSNVISIDSGLLSIQGFRSVNDTLTTYTVSVTPSEPIPFQLVATYSHYISDENDTLEITTRPVQELRREPLFTGQNAVYEVELAEFNMTADGIADFKVTLEKIVYNEQDLSELLDKVTKAEQDSATALEKVKELETQVIEKQGTVIKYGTEAQNEVVFDRDPQTQLNSKANQNGSYKTLSAGALITDDTRSVNSPPLYYYGKGSKVTSEFKNCSTVGLPSDETYCTVVTVCPWHDDSGGAITQTAYVGEKIYIRQSADDSTWGEWQVVAKTSQVVRTDTAQSLTDEQKQQAQENLALQGNATLTTPAWYKIASVSAGYIAKIIRVKLTASWGLDRPFSAEAIIAIAANSYSETTITTVGNFGHPLSGQSNIFSKIRLNGSNIEVYYNTSNSHTCKFEFENYDHNNANITIYDFETTSQSEVSGSCFVCDFVNGINTSGGVYQNGSPVFATDPSKLAPSTANGWTQTTATGSLPSAGVYMVVPNASLGTLGIGVMFYAENRLSAAAIGSAGDASSLFYASSGDTKWALYGDNATIIQLTDVYYKRIA